jgi:DNA-binding protein H-NS
MKDDNLRAMSIDELWALYEIVLAQLEHRIAVDRDLLETRLRRLGGVARHTGLRRARRAYPKVLAKYRNPRNHSETWAGRGKQPRWLAAELRSGKKLTDFLIG